MRLTKREKLLLAILVFAVLMYGSYHFIISGQLVSLDEKQLQVSNLQDRIQQMETLEDKDRELSQQISEVRAEQEQIKSTYFSVIDEQEEVILLLNEFLLNPDVTATSLSFTPPSTEMVDEVPLSSMNVTVSYNATYPSLLNLLRSVWQFDREILVSQLNMGAGEGETLSGNFQVNLYDLAHLTGDVENLFMWFEEVAPKTNPFTPASPEPPFQMRYAFIDSDSAMLAQQPYVPFEDIEGHWAEAAINALGERGVFPPTSNRNFSPDEFISRGEFIIFLDRLYEWPMPDEPVDLTTFEDYEELGRYESSISRALFSGYLSGFIVGYQDNTLRPFEPISYEEVEFIMTKVLENEAFTWQTQAQSIETETGHASAGLVDIKAYLTRGEAAYMLNQVAE